MRTVLESRRRGKRVLALTRPRGGSRKKIVCTGVPITGSGLSGYHRPSPTPAPRTRPSGFLTNDWCKHPPNVPYVPPVHIPVMSSVLARYEAFLVNNVSAISSVESTLRSVTWILPGRFKDAELTSEACTDLKPPSGISLDFLFQWRRC